MRRRSGLTALVVICIMASAVHAQPVIHDFIGPDDLEQYARWLRLSDEQAHAMRFMHERYLEQWNMHDEQRRDFLESGYWDAYGNQPRSLEEFERLIDERRDLLTIALNGYHKADELRVAYAMVDEMFFADLERILTDGQIERMQRVRNSRQRRIYAPTRTGLPEGSFDLVEWLEAPTEARSPGSWAQRIKRGLVELSEDEYAAVEPVIAAYEPMFVDALQRNARAARRSQNAHYSYAHISQYISLGQFTPDLAPELFEEQRTHRREFGRHRLGPAKYLEQINRQGLEMLMNALPEDKAKQLQQTYLQQAYPEVYPDRSSADALYAHVLAFDDLTDEQREAVEVLHQDFQRRHETLSQRMINRIRDRHHARMGDESIQGGLGGAWDDLRTLGDERLALNGAQAEILQQMLRPEQIERMPEWDFNKHPQPKPWDPRWR